MNQHLQKTVLIYNLQNEWISSYIHLIVVDVKTKVESNCFNANEQKTKYLTYNLQLSIDRRELLDFKSWRFYNPNSPNLQLTIYDLPPLWMPKYHT